MYARQAAAFLVAIAMASVAWAQVTPLGTTNSGPAQADGPRFAVAYDDKHDVVLYTWRDDPNIVGRFLGFDGVPRGAEFVIGSSAGCSTSPGDRPEYVCPRVAYSRGAVDDAFFVIWQTGAQLVRYTGAGATGGVLVGSLIPMTSGFDVLFNPVSREFVTTSATSGFFFNALLVVSRFSTSGTALGSVQGSDQGDNAGPLTDARIALDWARQQYAITIDRYFGGIEAPKGTSIVLTDAAFQFLARPLFEAYRAHVVYLPEADGFLAAWTQVDFPNGDRTKPPLQRIRTRFVPSTYVSGALGPTSDVIAQTDSDALWTLEHDPWCRCVLILATNSLAVLLDGTGQPFPSGDPRSGVFQLPTPPNTSFWPDSYGSLKSTRDGQMDLSHQSNGSAILDRLSAPVASTPGPRFSNPAGHIDGLAGNATVAPSFDVGGWALDFGASPSDGTGVDGVHVWAFPTNGGAPTFLGADQAFHARPDVAGVVGSHFLASGFDVNVSGLGPGTYAIGAYAHSAISKTFTQISAVTVTVAVPISKPFMSLDGPASGAIVKQPFITGGWAVDLGATSGVGVDAVHVWAFPVVNGVIGAGQFVAAAQLGAARPDVGAVFGSQFTNAGFNFLMTGLAPGQYYIGVYGHSAVTGTFNQQQFALVTIVP